MYEKIKAKAAATREFVKKNQTLVACSATAVVTASVVTYLNGKALYRVGYEHGHQMAVTSLCVDFIHEHDLEGPFLDHARSMIADVTAA